MTMKAKTEVLAHLALDGITINDRWMRQRCGWCGEILLEYDLERVAVPSAGSLAPPAFYPKETIVFKYGGVMQFVGNVDRLPDDCCATIETKRMADDG
jgi:hypothetical protein